MKPEPTIQQRLVRAKQLLREIHHVAIATVNEDGTPHSSPLFMAFDNNLNAFWASTIETQHSKNIAREGSVFMVVFDSREGHGGLYVRAKATVLEDKAEAEYGHAQLKKLKQQLGGDLGGLELYTGSGGQRIYQAKPLQCWVNKSDRNDQGIIIRDGRYEVSIEQLKP
jgi:hypothetical protein